MADTKRPSIPDWQKEDSTKFNEGEKNEAKTNSPPTSETQVRLSLVEQARKFLEHPEIRDAPTDRKIAFLEDKGLSQEEIQALLGVSRNVDASSSQPLTETKSSSNQSSSPSPPESVPSTSDSPTSPISLPSKDIPPIITYPEFLLHAHRPAPLVTRQRLLTTLYATASAGALTHATSTYLVKPMLETLTEARHILLGNTTENLTGLNKKLSEIVSTIPSGALNPALPQHDDESELSSEASDPSELFHRDAGVQTSPIDSLSSLDSPKENVKDHALADTNTLQSIQAHLSELKHSGENAMSKSEDVKLAFTELQGYLDDLRYAQLKNRKWDQVSKEWTSAQKDDEVGKIKAEIRSVKGVLLSAKSFPTSGIRGR